MKKGLPEEVAGAFAAFPKDAGKVLRDVRRTLLALTAEIGAGPVEESLTWGQPSYAVKKGTPVRLGLDGGLPAVFFHCQTTLVEGFRADFPEAFSYAGNRALHLKEPFDREALALCLTRALTYRRKKRSAEA